MPGKDEPPPVDFIRDPYGMEGCSMTAAKYVKMKERPQTAAHSTSSLPVLQRQNS